MDATYWTTTLATIWPALPKPVEWIVHRYRKVPMAANVRLCDPEARVVDEPCPSSNVTLCWFPPRQVQVTLAPAASGDAAGAKKLSHKLTAVALPPLPHPLELVPLSLEHATVIAAMITTDLAFIGVPPGVCVFRSPGHERGDIGSAAPQRLGAASRFPGDARRRCGTNRARDVLAQ